MSVLRVLQSHLLHTPLAPHRKRRRRKRGRGKDQKRETGGERRDILFGFERFPPTKGILASKRDKEKKDKSSPLSHTHQHQHNTIIKMAFATKLQINAVFKKAAPAKKTVTPAKKVRVSIYIVREESVLFEIRVQSSSKSSPF